MPPKLHGHEIVQLQLSALVVTHDQAESMAMSDRILLLNGGVIEQQGTPEQMYSDPATLFVADFMGSNNRIEGKVKQAEGKLSDDKGKEAEGKAQDALGKLADATDDAIDAAKAKAEELSGKRG